ncbi:MAG: DnaJ domain-containing protein [Desulfovermiculus sp.]|nr:DnaJ domain-containing protein [Desulfovermiculus sp.]
MPESHFGPALEKLHRLLQTAAASTSVHEVIIAVASDSDLLPTALNYVRQGPTAFGLSEHDLGVMCVKTGIRPDTFRSWMQTLSNILDKNHDHNTLYTVLGVDPSATPAEIKKAFRRKSLQFHPDHNPDDPQASERFRSLREAYNVLSSPSKRAGYDQSLSIWEDNWEEPNTSPPPRVLWSQRKRQAVMFFGTILSVFILVTLLVDYQGWMEQRSRMLTSLSSEEAPADPKNISNPQGLIAANGNENSSLQQVHTPQNRPTPLTSPSQPSTGSIDFVQATKTDQSDVVVGSSSPQAQTFDPDDQSRPNDSASRPSPRAGAKAFHTLFQESLAPLQLEQALQTFNRQVQEAPSSSRTAKGSTSPDQVLADASPDEQPAKAPEQSSTKNTDSLSQNKTIASKSKEPSAERKERFGPAQTEEDVGQQDNEKPRPPPSQAKDKNRKETQLQGVPTAKPQKPSESPEEHRESATESRGLRDVWADVNAFLNRYTRTYMDLDLERFQKFFTAQATENGEPFQSKLPTYQKTFQKMKRIKYEIMPQKCKLAESRIYVHGRFKIRAILKTNERVTSQGKIFLELIPNGPGFLVDSLRYDFEK